MKFNSRVDPELRLALGVMDMGDGPRSSREKK
jgi:hypothetical protein